MKREKRVARAPIERRDRGTLSLPRLDWHNAPDPSEALFDKLRIGFNWTEIRFRTHEDRERWIDRTLFETGLNRAGLFRRTSGNAPGMIYAEVNSDEFALSGDLKISCRNRSGFPTARVYLDLRLNIFQIIANRHRRLRELANNWSVEHEEFEPAAYFTPNESYDAREQPYGRGLDGGANLLSRLDEVRPTQFSSRGEANTFRLAETMNMLHLLLDEMFHPSRGDESELIADGGIPTDCLNIREAEVAWDFYAPHAEAIARNIGYGCLAAANQAEMTAFQNPRAFRERGAFGALLMFADERRQVLAIYPKQASRLRVEYRMNDDAIRSILRNGNAQNSNTLDKLSCLIDAAANRLRGRGADQSIWVWNNLGRLAQEENEQADLPEQFAELSVRVHEAMNGRSQTEVRHVITQLVGFGGLTVSTDTPWDTALVNALVRSGIIERRRLVGRERRQVRRLALTDEFMGIHYAYAVRRERVIGS